MTKQMIKETTFREIREQFYALATEEFAALASRHLWLSPRYKARSWGGEVIYIAASYAIRIEFDFREGDALASIARRTFGIIHFWAYRPVWQLLEGRIEPDIAVSMSSPRKQSETGEQFLRRCLRLEAERVDRLLQAIASGAVSI